MSLHTWHLQGPHKPSSYAIFMLNSHWFFQPQLKNSLASLHLQGRFCHVPLFVILTVACQASLSGDSPGKNNGAYWSTLVAIPFQSTIFPASQATNYPEDLVLRKNPETQVSVLPPHVDLTGENPSPPGQPQGQTPVDNPHAEVEIRPQLKPRGSVAEEEDPKPSHQLFKLQIKST